MGCERIRQSLLPFFSKLCYSFKLESESSYLIQGRTTIQLHEAGSLGQSSVCVI